MALSMPTAADRSPSALHQEHHDSKHEGIPFDPNACENAHAIHGGSTKGAPPARHLLFHGRSCVCARPVFADFPPAAGVAVHGTLKKAKQKAKLKRQDGGSGSESE